METATSRGRVGHGPRLLDDNTSFDVRCQWYLSCVTDANLVAFLKRSRAALRKGGVISVEDSVHEDGEAGVLHMHLDAEDSSVK